MISLLFSILFSYHGYASDIRVIGNGGGELEMKALTEFNQMPLILEMCLLEENYCQLTESERRMLDGLLKQGFDIHSPEKLEFHDSSKASYIFKRHEKILSVHTSLLEEGRLKNLFTGYARYVIGEHYWIDLIGEKIFESSGGWTLDYLKLMDSTQIAFLKSNQRLVIGSVRNGELENLTPKILVQLGCTSNDRLLNASKPHREGTGFAAELTWGCKDSRFTAKMIAELEAEQWKFRVFAVKPEFTGPNCLQLLKVDRSSF